jgi:hypothetical protein
MNEFLEINTVEERLEFFVLQCTEIEQAFEELSVMAKQQGMPQLSGYYNGRVSGARESKRMIRELFRNI